MDGFKAEKLDNEFDPLLECVIFGLLNRKVDLELILLKGHLLLETILEIVLKRNGVIDFEHYSFHRKIVTLENINFNNKSANKFIISSLKEINRLRNKVAHDFYFDIADGEFERWSSNTLDNLKGNKFSKYTFRTRIIHSFSVLTKNILSLNTLTNEENNKNNN